MSWLKQLAQADRADLLCSRCGFKESPATINQPYLEIFHDAPWFDYVSWECFRCEAVQITFLSQAPESVILSELADRHGLGRRDSDQPNEGIRRLHAQRIKVVMPVAAAADIDARVKAFSQELHDIVDAYHLQAMS